MSNTVSLQKVVGKNYADVWNCKKRYVAIKGSRASKKSKTAALNMIKKIMKHNQSNGLCVRKTEKSLRDSCFADLKWAINKLQVAHLFKCTVSPLEITYLPTGQKILFRGMDNPLKITSISVDYGVLCFVWVEEAYEIESQEDFDTLDESIRGSVPDGLYKQFWITFNPWSEHTWLKSRFFDTPSDDTLAVTKNYDCNEFLDEADLKMFEKMKQNNPRRYRIAGLGEWGVAEGLVYDRFKFGVVDLVDDEGNKVDGWYHCFGLDFGYTNDPSAFIAFAVNKDEHLIYVYDEFYSTKMLNSDIAKEIISKGYQKEQIIADCAEPKSIDDLRRLGISRIEKSVKGKDSIINGISQIQEYKIIVNPRCKNTFMELSSYCFKKDKTGKTLNIPEDNNNHLMDAMRYGFKSVKYKHKEENVRRTAEQIVTSDDMLGGWN